VKSDNSHYSIFKDQNFLSTERRNFNVQSTLIERSTLDALVVDTANITTVTIGNWQSPIDNVLVEVRGFEPLTPWLQTMCSAN
jgi:hypothetical protein